MVRQAHHDNCHPEPVEGWIARSGLSSDLIGGPDDDKMDNDNKGYEPLFFDHILRR